MNGASKSVFVFGLYSTVLGLSLLLIPDVILPVVKLPVSGEPWLNLMGFVLTCSSYYYIRAALSANIDFARYTVHTRFAAPMVVTLLVLFGKADSNFLLFGVVDGLGGLWTWLELRNIKSTLSAGASDVMRDGIFKRIK